MKWAVSTNYIFDQFVGVEVGDEMFGKVGYDGYVDEVEEELEVAYNVTIF